MYSKFESLISHDHEQYIYNYEQLYPNTQIIMILLVVSQILDYKKLPTEKSPPTSIKKQNRPERKKPRILKKTHC